MAVSSSQHSVVDPPKLARILTPFETIGFSLGGLLLWLGTAPSIHRALGPQALMVWLVGTVGGVMLNLQVRHLGQIYPNLSGGTPNYVTQLLKNYPAIACYSAIGYWLGWVSIPPINAILLTDLIQTNLAPLDIQIPTFWVCFFLTSLPYIMAFSGTRALGILHSFFVLPAIGLLIVFCGQGFIWMVAHPEVQGMGIWAILQSDFAINKFSAPDWLQWYFVAVYAVYGAETGSSFVADSQKPRSTLNFITLAAILLPIVYLGGSLVMAHLGSAEMS